MTIITNFPGTAEIEMTDEVICHCFQATASEILEAKTEGRAESIEEITRQTGAGGGCGGCHCRIRRLLAGFPAECGPCFLCPGCGHIKKLCLCEVA